MKQLLLVRHGNAERQSSTQKDIDRGLTRGGHKDAPDMANRFVEKGVVPDYIMTSNANRALTTAKYFAKVWNIASESIKILPSIYEADTYTLLKVVNEVGNQYDKIAIFGHNPGFTEFGNYLSNANIFNIPPAGLVWIEFPFDDWSLISRATGNLLLFDYPRDPDE